MFSLSSLFGSEEKGATTRPRNTFDKHTLLRDYFKSLKYIAMSNVLVLEQCSDDQNGPFNSDVSNMMELLERYK
jgi:hypothetical protein